MSHTALAVQDIVDGGLNPAYGAAPAAGNRIADNEGDVYIEVVNGGGSSINVTIPTGGTLDGEPVADKVVAVPNGERRKIGPFRPRAFNQPIGDPTHPGDVLIEYSAVTTVTVGAFRARG